MRKILQYMDKLSKQNCPCSWLTCAVPGPNETPYCIHNDNHVKWILHTYKVILSASMHISPTAKQTKTRTNIQYLHYLRFHLFLHT